MKWPRALTALALVLLLLFPATAGAKPRITEIFPEEGDVLAEPPTQLHMCFATPINIRDLDKGGDFGFQVLKPDGRGVGLRIVFRSDGFGVTIFPNVRDVEGEGDWTFEWRLTDPNTLEASEGTVRFSVQADGEPLPEEPATCTGTPAPSDGGPGPAAGQTDDDGPDIAKMALITGAAVIGAGVVGMVLYLVRRRIGFWLHRPPPRDDGEATPEHH